MKKLIPLAVLGAVLSLGTTSMALADGGETGADAAHTQPYWPQEDGSNFYNSGSGYHAPFVHERARHGRRYEAE